MDERIENCKPKLEKVLTNLQEGFKDVYQEKKDRNLYRTGI